MRPVTPVPFKLAHRCSPWRHSNLSLSVGCKDLESVFLGGVVGITSKQEPQGWIGQRCDVDKSRCRLYWISRLFTIVVSLKADCSADRPVVLLPPFAKLRGG